MDLGLNGKRVLVTAASKGLGYASARAFLINGARVIVSSSNSENLKKAYESLKSLGEVYMVKADLTKKDEIDNLFSEVKKIFNGLDVLIYVTGGPRPGRFMDLSDDDWVRASELLMLSAVRCARHAAELMTQGGRIIFSASTAIKEPIEDLVLSDVVRISIAGLVRTLSKELGRKGILVNSVLPGLILTDRVKELAMNRAKKENKDINDVIKEMSKDIPLGRLGSPEEYANVILFLASNLATYINGASIPIDGGLLKSVF
ncbi:MAG: SDR family oxidoreductase [Thermoprotei archaeon]|jgi:3-oxoacyl-[acyl-carrier protein] reductase